MIAKKTIIITSLIAVLLFIVGFQTWEYFFTLIRPKMEHIIFSVTSLNGQFTSHLLFSISLAIVPVAAVLLWKSAPIVSPFRKILSVVFIVIGMITSVFIRRELIIFADWSPDPNVHSVVPIEQLRFEIYAIVGLLAGSIIAYFLLREKKSTITLAAVALVLVCFCPGCTDSDTNTDNRVDSLSDTVADVDTLHIQTDTLVKDSLEVLRDVSNWKPEDFIIDANIYSTSEVWSSIDWQLEQVKNLRSPFVARFTTVEIGDYFHLNFETEEGRVLDFGDGENNLGEYVLYSAPDYVENQKYAGKKFLVYWNWEIASFQCCSGSYNTVKAYVPTITKLELIDSDAP